MFSTDLIAELRAEVTHWWETVVRPTQQRRIDQETSVNQSRADVPTQARSDIMQANPSSSVITPILGAMLVDGPLRLITLGQELFADLDEKSLGEVGFKDGQVKIYTNVTVFCLLAILLTLALQYLSLLNVCFTTRLCPKGPAYAKR
jgi:hypothetical protein